AKMNDDSSKDAATPQLGTARSPSMYTMPSRFSNMEAEAWVDYAQGKHEEALKTMRAAAKQEEASGVDSLTMPAREMLGDMLLEMKRPGEALVEYKAALVESPNRFDGLYGAAQAAQLAGNATEARGYLAKLVKVCSPDADRPELQEAREEVAKQ
ncbi:MAG TPA: hypothetical protein VKB26_00355, partial [Candidatus Acidoferrales bacterium]|nr:hypothetical protein [Candidatus Acidoferrales bacterium]